MGEECQVDTAWDLFSCAQEPVERPLWDGELPAPLGVEFLDPLVDLGFHLCLHLSGDGLNFGPP